MSGCHAASGASRARRIFEEIVDIADGDEREAALRSACGDNAALAEEVSSLIQALEQSDGQFLDTDCLRREAHAAAASMTAGDGLPEKPGTKVGPFELLDELGAGGFGIVYRAVQREPIRREVAVKILKPGLDTREVVSRFQAELQALALMEHPGIAQVHDAGMTSSGRPYFAMELIDGRPITEYCRQHELSLEARLRLFLDVCSAVQHAHQKGVIHRDLKPSNILVKPPAADTGSGTPTPKIIDFGIAKAIDIRLTDETLVTQPGRMLGTPQYMSPEQAGLDGAGIDTRSDIYSLGTIFYELLTGAPPLSGDQMKDRSLTEIERLIREREPARPSVRIGRRANTARATAFHNDLDWIALKALEKDRDRRYQSVEALAADVRRFLASEPVLASPPSTAYRLRKYARRHQAQVMTVASSLALIVILTVGFVWRLVLSEREAKANEAEARRNETTALAAKAAAVRESEKSRQIAEFFKETLSAAGPSKAMGRDATMLKDILEKTVNRVETDLADRPEVRAELQSVIGRTYDELAEYQEAVRQRREALRLRREVHAGDHPLVAASLMDLAASLEKQGEVKQAEKLGREGLEMWRRLKGPDAIEVAAAESDVAWTLLKSGRPLEGEDMARHAYEIWLTHPTADELADVPTSMIFIYKNTGRNHLATPIFRADLERHRKLYGKGHFQMVSLLDNFGYHLTAIGEDEEAEKVLQEAYILGRKYYGDRSPHEDHVLAALARLAKKRGDLKAQLDYSRRAMEAGARVYPAGHRYWQDCHAQYARTLLEQIEMLLDRAIKTPRRPSRERIASVEANSLLSELKSHDDLKKNQSWIRCLEWAVNQHEVEPSAARSTWTAALQRLQQEQSPKSRAKEQARRIKKFKDWGEALFGSEKDHPAARTP